MITWFLFFFLITSTTLDSIIWRFILVDENLIVQLSRFAIFMVFVAVIIKTISVERGINRSGLYKGYYFTPICLLTLILSFILAYNPLEWLIPIVLILVYVGWSLMPLVFFYLAIKTTGDARKDSSRIALGSLINLLGMLLQSSNENPTTGFNINVILSGLPNFEWISIVLMMIYPIVSILGMTLIYIGIKSTFDVMK